MRACGVRCVRAGELDSGADGPGTGQSSFCDWGFDVVKIAGLLVTNGAQFAYTADDAFNPSVDSKHPGIVFPLPGPGMFAAMMLKLMYPHRKDSAFCAGKGGNVGIEYMMERGIAMLQEQGHSGNLDEILMVGDRFDTDVRGGLSVGVKTCLVLTGCHCLDMQPSFQADPTTWYAESVGKLIPDANEAAPEGESMVSQI